MSVPDLLTALRSGTPVFAAELRPPRAELAAREGMDAWIDTYHAVRRLTRQGTYVFLTDSAVGAEEEDNLRHLVTNLGTDVPRERIVPFLTSKHTPRVLPVVCRTRASERLSGARGARRRQDGWPAAIGRARVAASALLRSHDHALALGGWANPHGDAERQVDYLSASDFHAEFYLTQIVSHHDVSSVSRFLERVGKARAVAARRFRRVLLPKREPEDAEVRSGVFCRCLSRA